ncbi:MAG TPA: HAD family hydrolase [Gemmatimonadaceae bacterium]|nr:HAD family hydrolase [Gemmatimonadaceae bacterium]
MRSAVSPKGVVPTTEPDTRQLAIFDIDGTLTATNAVDDECYTRAVGETLGVAPEAIDWSDAPHVTDGGIARHLWTRYRARAAEAQELAELRERFLAILGAEVTRAPERFVAIAGAATLFASLRSAGWHVALATGGWVASAAVKLRAAGLWADDLPMACADDAESREDIVRLARQRAEVQAGVAFARVVSVGDAPWDVRTARSLGLPFVGIATGGQADRLRAEGAETILPDLSDVAAVLAALSSAATPHARPGDVRREIAPTAP